MLDITKRMVLEGSDTEVRLVEHAKENEYIFAWENAGVLCVGVFNGSGLPRSHAGRHIVNAPAKRTVRFWLNVYEGGAIFAHTSRESAAIFHCGRTEVLEFTREYTEGEGLK